MYSPFQWLDQEYGFHSNNIENIANEVMIFPISFVSSLYAHGNSSICIANFISLVWENINKTNVTFKMMNPSTHADGYSFYRCILIGY